MTLGEPGVMHGFYSYLLQDEAGNPLEAYSISAGLDYPGVGPEHAYLKDEGLVRYEAVTDREALDAFALLHAHARASSRPSSRATRSRCCRVWLAELGPDADRRRHRLGPRRQGHRHRPGGRPVVSGDPARALARAFEHGRPALVDLPDGGVPGPRDAR